MLIQMKMLNSFILLLFIFVKCFHSLNIDPIPPQPSQYTTSIIFNGINGIYYSDTSIYRERLDLSNQNSYTIIDFEHLRQYILSKNQDECSWNEIPGKISPLLSFRTYTFIGNETHNNTLCYKWNGCHYYQIPPAPYDYYATVKQNLPVDLNLVTVDFNIHFLNLTYGPPPSNIFQIPINCTKLEFNSIYSNLIINNNNNNLITLC